jgi:uncharacterized protein (TIGR00730 family)
MKRICVFCGSSMGSSPVYKEAAKELADLFVSKNIGLVYGGANVGLMKILADTLLEADMEVIGVMPHSLIQNEVAHTELEHFIEVETMSERKNKMAELSDAFIALPGGFGTLDELSEVLTYNQLRICDKPLGFLNTAGYYDKFLDFVDHAVEEGFVRGEHRKNLIVSDDVALLIQKLQSYQPLETEKWIRDIKEESGNKEQRKQP